MTEIATRLHWASPYCIATKSPISSSWPSREADSPREGLSPLEPKTQHHLTSSPRRGHRATMGGRSMSNTNPTNPGPARRLPRPANLEHLRKEAKQRLKVMRLDNPGATLAAAQFAVAREYGFTSWRRLVAYVKAKRDKEAQLRDQIRAANAFAQGPQA